MIRSLIFASAIVLGACNVTGTSDMPNLDDAAEIRAAVIKLDPIAPGGKPEPSGQYGEGQHGSDRSYFTAWLRRYANEDVARRQDIDYKPASVPSSMSEAIADQKAYEMRQARRDAAQRLQNEHTDADRQERQAAAAAEVAARTQQAESAGEPLDISRVRQEANINSAFEQCERQREEARAQQLLEDSGAYERLYPCERQRDAVRRVAEAPVSNAM